jgi:hypothetical protein
VKVRVPHGDRKVSKKYKKKYEDNNSSSKKDSDKIFILQIFEISTPDFDRATYD